MGRPSAVHSLPVPADAGARVPADPPAPAPPFQTTTSTQKTSTSSTLTTPTASSSTRMTSTTTMTTSSSVESSTTSTTSPSYKLSLTMAPTSETSLSISTSTSSIATSTPASSAKSTVAVISTVSSTAPQIATASNAISSSGLSHHDEVIILASIFSALGALLIGIAGFFLVRYCQRRRGHTGDGRRGVTPIDDDEIDSWRLPNPPAMAKAGALPARLSESAMIRQHEPQHSSNSIVYIQSPALSEAFPISPLEIPSSAYTAQAPNARVGLTDQARPGDEPFIDVFPQRHGSRLQKQRSSSHSQTDSKHGRSRSIGPSHPKSRTSSISASIQERPPTWFDGEDMVVQKALEELTRGTIYQDYIYGEKEPSNVSRHSRVQSNTGVSDNTRYSEKSLTLEGLSPRPISRGRDVTGRYFSFSKRDEES